MITEQLRPKTISELFGNKEGFRALETNFPEQHILLYGPSGVGKTSASIIMANKLNLRAFIYDCGGFETKNEIKTIYKNALSKTFTPSMIILEDIDLIPKESSKIIDKIFENAKIPIIATSSSYKVLKKGLKKNVRIIQLYAPKTDDITRYIDYIRKKYPNLPYKLKQTSNDFRSALINTVTGADGYFSADIIMTIKNGLLTKDWKEFDMKNKMWLLDNAFNIMYGYNVYKFIRIVQIAVENNDPNVLACLQEGKISNIKYPIYYQKYSEIKRGKSET